MSLRVSTQMLACYTVAFIVSLTHLMPGKPSMISTVGEASFVTLFVHQLAMGYLNMSFVLTQGGDESTCKPGDCPLTPCLHRSVCAPDKDAPVLKDTLFSIGVFFCIALLQVRPPKHMLARRYFENLPEAARTKQIPREWLFFAALVAAPCVTANHRY